MAKCSHPVSHHNMPELRPVIHKVSWAYFSWKKWWILIYTILIVIFISVTLCQADFTHSWYDYCTTAGSSRANANATPAWGWGAREEEVWHCTFILDAKLTMVRCFSLFCWAVLSSGRLSLLAAQSHPPQKSRHKIKLELLYGLSSPTPHTKSTIDSLLWLCTYSWSKCSTSNSCLLQKTTYSWRARHKCTNDKTITRMEYYLCPVWHSTKVSMSSLAICYMLCWVLSDSGELRIDKMGLVRPPDLWNPRALDLPSVLQLGISTASDGRQNHWKKGTNY